MYLITESRRSGAAPRSGFVDYTERAKNAGHSFRERAQYIHPVFPDRHYHMPIASKIRGDYAPTARIRYVTRRSYSTAAAARYALSQRSYEPESRNKELRIPGVSSSKTMALRHNANQVNQFDKRSWVDSNSKNLKLRMHIE